MQIIFLNGPSSSGKTTLAKALQKKLSKPFLHFSIDKMIGMMPAKTNCFEGHSPAVGFWWKKVNQDTEELPAISAGPFGQMIATSFRNMAVFLAKEGHNLIIDTVCFKEEMPSWKDALNPFDTLFVELTCPGDILEKREEKRGDRMRGSAKEQLIRMQGQKEYHLSIDTNLTSLESMVDKIIGRMAYNKESFVIEKLKRPEQVQAELAVVIDVIRAFTTAAYAFHAGAEKILLVMSKEEAFRLKEMNPSYLLMGEENGFPIEGFDFGNSPSQWSGEVLKSKTLVQRTSSGTQAVCRSRGSQTILVSSFAIAEATIRHIERIKPSTISFVITGFRDGDEDLALADYIEASLLMGKVDPKPYLERVIQSVPAKGFSKESAHFPSRDIELATTIDRFPFSIEVTEESGHLVARPVY